jgi:hypothetical protein
MRKKVGTFLLFIMLLTSSIFVFQMKQIKATGKTNGDWWNTDWNYRKLITINSSQVESTLFNFPVLINLASDSDLVAHAQADGDDIAFVLDIDNTQLNHEIETFNATTGEFNCWVNVTSLSSTVDTMIWMYYGNPSCSSQQNIIGTWDSSFGGVWHLGEISGTFNDSTTNNYDGTIVGTPTGRAVAGLVANCIHFSGTNNYINMGDVLDLASGSFTIECCIKPDVLSIKGLITKYLPANPWTGWGLDQNNGGIQFWSNNKGSWQSSTGTPISVDNWCYIALTLEEAGIDDPIDYFFNGTYDSTDNSKNPSDSNANLVFAAEENGQNNFFDGFMDEVRISTIQRSNAWISTTYDTIHNTTTFISIGVEEMQSNIIVSDPYPEDGAIDVEITPIMSISVSHSSGNQMNITWKWNNSGSWDVFGTNYNVFDGTYNQINMNFSSYQTTYEWRVEANDGIGNWVNESYSFTTRPENYLPVLSNPLPSNGSTSVVAGNVTLSISVSDGDGDLMNITFMTNASGSWQTIGTNVSVPEESYQQNYDFLDYNKTYWWSVNATDGHGWTNETYSFTTLIEDNEPPKVNITSPQLGFIYIYVLITSIRLHILPANSTLIIGKIEIKVDATDNIGVSWVKIYINDKLRATISEKPYIWDWNELTIYDLYKIKAVASDLSGNQGSDEIEVFKIQLFEIGL